MSCSSQLSKDQGGAGRTGTAELDVALEPIAKEQAEILHNMGELYAHDFSEHVPLDLKPNGRFDVSLGDRWWTEGHYPFFIRRNDKLAGFALAQKGSRVTGLTDVMDVAEFFVIRAARGRKLGMTVAHALFKAFPGPWEMRVRQTNVAAIKFWLYAVEAWTAKPVSKTSFSAKGVNWEMIRIDSSGDARQL